MEERNAPGMCAGELLSSLVACSASPSSSELLPFEQGFLVLVWYFCSALNVILEVEVSDDS